MKLCIFTKKIMAISNSLYILSLSDINDFLYLLYLFSTRAVNRILYTHIWARCYTSLERWDYACRSSDTMQHSQRRFIKTSTRLILTQNILLTDSVSTTRRNNPGEIQPGRRITQCKETSTWVQLQDCNNTVVIDDQK